MMMPNMMKEQTKTNMPIIPAEMKLKLNKKPKGATIIEGFPGFGLIGTIATEFLLEHLKTEKIGSVEINDSPAMIAIHDNKIIEPIAIHYNKKYNVVIVHSIHAGKGQGWQLADKINELADEIKAKEIVSLEGVGSLKPSANNEIFYYTTGKKREAGLKGVAKPLTEGIIVGVTGAILVRQKKIPVTALFAETATNMPDSKAAAMIIKTLDQYLGLKVDYRPLIKQAERFEEKLKGLLDKSKKVHKIHKKKMLNYFG